MLIVPNGRVTPFSHTIDGSEKFLQSPRTGYIQFASSVLPKAFDMTGPFSWLSSVYFDYTSGNDSFYIWSRENGSVASPAARVTMNSGNGTLAYYVGSTGNSNRPTATSTNYFMTGLNQKKHMWFGGVSDGSVLISGVELYWADGIKPMHFEGSSGINGGGSVLGGVGNNLLIGNSTRYTTTGWTGRINVVAFWNRKLSLPELELARRRGPPALRDGLIFCWAGGKDHGPFGLRPTAVASGYDGRVGLPRREVV